MQNEKMEEKMASDLKAKDELIKTLQDQLNQNGASQEQQNSQLTEMQKAFDQKTQMVAQLEQKLSNLQEEKGGKDEVIAQMTD